MATFESDLTSTEPTANRPHFSPGYGLAAADQGAGLFPWSWVTERMESARNYWIGSTRPDGRPHAAPVWGIWLDGAFYFSTDPRSRKGKNLQANPQVTVHLESGDEAVILEGVVEQLTEETLFARFVEAYDQKYHVRPDAIQPSVVYGLRPRTAYAWREQDFTDSATRWSLSATARSHRR